MCIYSTFFNKTFSLNFSWCWRIDSFLLHALGSDKHLYFITSKSDSSLCLWWVDIVVGVSILTSSISFRGCSEALLQITKFNFFNRYLFWFFELLGTILYRLGFHPKLPSPVRLSPFCYNTVLYYLTLKKIKFLCIYIVVFFFPKYLFIYAFEIYFND